MIRSLSVLVSIALWMPAASALQQFSKDCDALPTGLTPLTDMVPGETYLGHAGGLYPDGTNSRPPAHLQDGLDIVTTAILPRDAAGNSDPTGGLIGVASIGMSNMRMSYAQLLVLAGADPSINPSIRLVNGAQGGHAVDEWADPTSPAGADAWADFAQELVDAGVAPAQLQVVVFGEIGMRHWLQSSQVFPDRVQETQAHLEQTLRNIKTFYPSVRVCYLTSRSYAGYCLYDDDANPLTPPIRLVPQDYEDGFAPKWTIAKQIAGDASLAFKGAAPVAPWVTWCPYLWVDGINPSDNGRTVECTQYLDDGHHPSQEGRIVVATLLLDFLKSDPTATPWFLPTTGGGGGGGTPPPSPAPESGSASGRSCSGAASTSFGGLLALILAISACGPGRRPSASR